MGTGFKVICLCLLITLTVQENPWKPRLSRDVDTTKVKPQNIVGGFTSHIKNLVSNANRVESVQKSIEAWIREGDYISGKEIVKDIADKLKVRLQQKITAVKAISIAVETALNGKIRKQAYHRCCELPSEYKVTYDPRYKDKVTDAVFCQMKAPAHLKEKTKADFSSVRTVFDTNKNKVKWQYFGSTEGISTMFPAARVSKCGKYDNRIRPWYVTTATPSPKNIVILLDSSTSIGLDHNIDAAKDTAKLVVSTLNPQDKVSVILFNSSTILPGDNNTDECYNKTMAFAGTFTINYLKSFIDRAQPKGATRYIKAFQKAFEILKNTLKSSSKSIVTRPSMVLLLTDGAPKTNSVVEKTVLAIKKEVELFKKEYKQTTFKVLTLLLGRGKKSKEFVNKLTQETNGISMAAQAGKNDPYSKLQAYFEYLMEATPAKESDVVFSPPYVDAWGLGFMITAASPYFHDNKLRGVAGVDILMTDLLSDVQYFNQAGPKSYAFLVHSKTGHTMSHPKLPTPESITEDPNSVNILELEQGEEFKQLFEDVQKTGKFREKTFKTRTSSISRGAVQGDGVQTEDVDYKYSCMPVDVREKDYIVCVALEKGDTGATYKSLFIENQMSSAPITYHRMDVLPEAKTCYYTDTVSYADRSVIKFSAKAFVDSSGYLEADDSKKAIQGYVNQMKGIVYRYQQSDVFTKDTVITAMLTSMADDTWFSTVNQKKYLRKFVRRYIGTYNGVLRVFPGAPLPTNFDHISRPWFIRAVANEGSVSLTAPYLDPLGAGFIVSISETLKTEHGKKNLFGVIGADLAISNFGAMFKNNIGQSCKSGGKLHCFLLDSSGYVVYHPSFKNVYNDSTKVLNKHITETDAEIARDMIKNGLMVRRKCQNFNLLKLQRFYEITMNKDIHRGSIITKKPRCKSYAMVKVSGTNLFVVAFNCFTNRASCPCQDTCTLQESEACECPCKSRLEYNFCNASLTGGSDIPVCAQPSPLVPARAPLPQHPDDLGKCFNVHCGDYKEEQSCNEIFGCFWCYKMTDGRLLKSPSCKSDRKCYGGVLGREIPFLLPHKHERKAKDRKMFKILGLKLNMVTLIAGSSALGLLVLISIVTICCLCRRKTKYGEEEMDFEAMEMFAVEDQPQMMDTTDMLNVDQGFGAMQLNYPGQSTAMQSNMQMRLGGAGMHGYSTQAMSGMWSKAYGPSRLMSFVPQVSTMQTPGAYTRKPPGKKSRRKKPRKVSFSEELREGAEEEPIAVPEDDPTVTEDTKVTKEEDDL